MNEFYINNFSKLQLNFKLLQTRLNVRQRYR